jgi:hypothetical protein
VNDVLNWTIFADQPPWIHLRNLLSVSPAKMTNTMKIIGLSFFIRKPTQTGHDIPYHEAVKRAFNQNGWGYNVLVDKGFKPDSKSDLFLPILSLPPAIKFFRSRSYFIRVVKFFFWELWRLLLLLPGLLRYMSGKKNEFDAVFIECFSLSELLYSALSVWLAPKKQFWVLYRFDKDSLGPMKDDVPARIAAPFYKFFTRFFFKKFNGRMFLFTDSDLLTNSLNEYFELPFTTLPIPHLSQLCYAERATKNEDDGKTVLWWPGRNDSSKGLDSIQKLIDNSPDLDFFAELKVFEGSLNGRIKGGKLDLVEVPTLLDDKAYYRLLHQADFVLLPYSPKRFKSATSGIFVEAVACGAIPIVTRGTWMAHELSKHNLDELIFEQPEDELVEILNTVKKNLGPITLKTRALREKYLTFHGEKGFSSALAASIKEDFKTEPS